jgi:DNA polymerase I-like protein with 3'-5' exonuclease and polymerase domains
MIVSDEIGYNKFLNENSDGRCIIHIVVNNDNFHGVVSVPLAVFVKNIDTDKVYVININHYDVEFSVTKEKLVNDLNNLYCTKFVVDKKNFLHILPVLNLYDLQLIDFMESGKLDETNYIPANYQFYYTKFKNFAGINNAIPLTIHSQVFDNICKIYEETIEDFKEDDSYKNVNNSVIENLQKIEYNGLYVDSDKFNESFKERMVNPINNYVYTEYFLYTSTSRPSNRFGNVNYSALNKENGCRSSFISRHGDKGMLLLIDYSAYHPHIVGKLINYTLPDDVYTYLGKYYYGKDELTPEEVKAAKNMTFQCMYGNIPPELLEIPYYKKMNEYIAHRWQYFKENGYVETPLYKRRITDKNILDANPNKLFNYILQASETEFGMRVLSDINQYLKDKETKVVLYTYDSFMFDIHKDDGKQTLLDIKKIMNNNGFPVKSYIGQDFNHMITVNI